MKSDRGVHQNAPAHFHRGNKLINYVDAFFVQWAREVLGLFIKNFPICVGVLQFGHQLSSGFASLPALALPPP